MIKKGSFILVYAVLLIALLYTNLYSDITVSIHKAFTEFPLQHKGWVMRSHSPLSDTELAMLKPDDYLNRQYVNADGTRVHLYISFHGGGNSGGGIHSPKHCLPGSGWYKISEEQLQLPVGTRKVSLVKAVYQKGEGKELFLYWYQVKGKSISDEYLFKLSGIVNALLYRRRDAAFIRISVPFEADPDRAFSAGSVFVKDFYPVITGHLPK